MIMESKKVYPEVNDFWRFVVERQKIWFKKEIERKPYPWTGDPILRRYRFCNVYRELDKCTRHLIENLDTKDRKTIFLNVFIFRHFNYYGFFDDIGIIEPGFDEKEIISKLDRIRKRKKIFNEAYVIHPISTIVPKDSPFYNRRKEKHVQMVYLTKYVDERLDDILDNIDSSETPEDVHTFLMKIPNISDFMAYELWTDLTYFGFFKRGWTDNDFVNVGSGAIWGLNLISFNKDTNELQRSKKYYERIIYNLRDNMKEYLDRLGLLDTWMEIYYRDAYSNVPFLSLRNIEHSLCEFRKYWRIKFGRGRIRRYR